MKSRSRGVAQRADLLRDSGGGGPPLAGVRDRAVGCGLVAAVAVAPFMALAFGPSAALVVAALALGAVAYLVELAAWAAPMPTRRRLRLLAAINAALALACLMGLLLRIA